MVSHVETQVVIRLDDENENKMIIRIEKDKQKLHNHIH